MKFRVGICFALCGLLAVPVLAGPLSKADFAERYASAINLGRTDAASAVSALQNRGLVGLEFDVNGDLTYGDLVDIFDRAGINATTRRPDLPVDADQLDIVTGNLTTQANGGGGGDDEKDPDNNGRKRRPKGQQPNSRANPNAFFGRDEG